MLGIKPRLTLKIFFFFPLFFFLEMQEIISSLINITCISYSRHVPEWVWIFEQQ